MSTTLICSSCGGVIGGNGARGRPCMCSRVGRGGALASTTTAGDSSVSGSGSVAVQKLCSVCGVDVTNRKRMKDNATGKYWCYDCGMASQSRKGHGMMMTCAACKKSFPPVKMVRSPKDQDVWVCDECADSQSGKKKQAKPATPEAANSSAKSVTPSISSGAKLAKSGGGKTAILVGVMAVVAGLALAALWLGGII